MYSTRQFTEFSESPLLLAAPSLAGLLDARFDSPSESLQADMCQVDTLPTHSRPRRQPQLPRALSALGAVILETVCVGGGGCGGGGG